MSDTEQTGKKHLHFLVNRLLDQCGNDYYSMQEILESANIVKAALHTNNQPMEEVADMRFEPQQTPDQFEADIKGMAKLLKDNTTVYAEAQSFIIDVLQKYYAKKLKQTGVNTKVMKKIIEAASLAHNEIADELLRTFIDNMMNQSNFLETNESI